MAATGLAIKLLLHLPPSYSSLDSTAKWTKIMKCCPACGSSLVSFREKHGEINTAVSKTGTIGGGNRTSGIDGLHKQPFHEERITSWYCSKCGVHMIPELDNPGVKKESKTKRASTGSMLSGATESSGMSGKPPLAPRQVMHAKRRSENLSRESLLNNPSVSTQNLNGYTSKEVVTLHSNPPRGSLSSSPQSPGNMSTIIDNTYIAFERGIQDGLTALLNHIRHHLMQKEGQLKEYQVDMLQRERTLKAHEQDFFVRITRLEQTEKSLKNKRDRLQIYKDSMMFQLEAKAKQLAKFEKRLQWTNHNTDGDHSTQNDSSGLSNNSSANPAIPPRQTRDTSWNPKTSVLDHTDGETQKETRVGGGYHPHAQNSAIVNDGRTSYYPHQQRYSNGSNTHTFRLSYTGPSSNNSQQNITSVVYKEDKSNMDKDWKEPSYSKPATRMSNNNGPYSSNYYQHSTNTVLPSSTLETKPTALNEEEQTGVLHVDTGYYSVRDGEQRRLNSHASTVTHNTSTSSLLQVDDERWRHQQEIGEPSSVNGHSQQSIPNQQQLQQKPVLSHEQLDRRYYPAGHESRRSYDLTQQPMKESPRQAWLRTRNKIESAQQQNQTNYNNQQHEQQADNNNKQKYLQVDKQHLQPKSWNSSPNLMEPKSQFSSSYDELPESHRLNSSYDGILDPEINRDSSNRDSHLERNISVAEVVQVSSPTSPPPAYNGQSGPPLPRTYQPHPAVARANATAAVMVNGYSPHGSNEDTGTAQYRDRYQSHDYYYQTRDIKHYSPGSRAYYEEKVAPRHTRRVTEL